MALAVAEARGGFRLQFAMMEVYDEKHIMAVSAGSSVHGVVPV
jgi:hypothetical protein